MEEKKTVAIVATVPLGTVATTRNFKKRKKKRGTKCLTKFPLQINSEKSGMNSA